MSHIHWLGRCGITCLEDPPSPDHEVILIKDTGLPRGNGSLRHAEIYASPLALKWGDHSQGAWMIVADFGSHFDRLLEMFKRDPIAAIDDEGRLVEGIDGPYHDPVEPVSYTHLTLPTNREV